MSSTKKNDQTYFSSDWLTDPDFVQWLVLVPESTKAKGKLYKKTFSLSNMGCQALTSHASGQKHVKVVNATSVFAKPRKKSKVLTPNASKNLSHAVISNQTQPTITNYITNSDTKKAEICWVLKCVTSSFSNNSCLKFNDFFCAMFPDSKIKLGADKIRYAVNFGIAPYVRSLLVDDIKQSSCFIPCFDESLSSQTQTCEMDLVIRYFNKAKKCVDVRYFNSSFFGHGTAIDLKLDSHGLKKFFYLLQ